MEAIPTREIQAECELKPAEFLESVARGAIGKLSTDQEWLRQADLDIDQVERLRHAVVRKTVHGSNLLQDLKELRMETALLQVVTQESYARKMWKESYAGKWRA
jgi:hypothetical protein